MKKIKLLMSLILISIASTVFSQKYVQVMAYNKGFGKKINVECDFGDKKQDEQKANEYKEKLNGTKSFSKIINFMVEKNYKLKETIPQTLSGRLIGFVYIFEVKE